MRNSTVQKKNHNMACKALKESDTVQIRVRQRRCPLAPDKWFWPVDKWVVNLTCPLDK